MVALVSKDSFLKFEDTVLKSGAGEGAQGLCHMNSRGDVLISCYRGSDPGYFAEVLVHEATFCDDEQARALETRHSTAREAARVAGQARARRLVLTHVSTRYDREPERLLAEAAEEFAGPTLVAHDGLVLELPPRED